MDTDASYEGYQAYKAAEETFVSGTVGSNVAHVRLVSVVVLVSRLFSVPFSCFGSVVLLAFVRSFALVLSPVGPGSLSSSLRVLVLGSTFVACFLACSLYRSSSTFAFLLFHSFQVGRR